MKPFDLKAALRGEKVVTRDGREVTQLVKFDVEDCNRPVVGVVDDSIYKWSLAGGWAADSCDSILDLFMHEEPEEQWKPSACCSFRWVERKKIKPSGDPNGGYYGYIEKVLQQLYVNKLKPEYEWRDVPTVKEEEQ